MMGDVIMWEEMIGEDWGRIVKFIGSWVGRVLY